MYVCMWVCVANLLKLNRTATGVNRCQNWIYLRGMTDM